MNMDVIKDISDYVENDRNDAINNEVGNYNPIFVETFTLTSSFLTNFSPRPSPSPW